MLSVKVEFLGVRDDNKVQARHLKQCRFRSKWVQVHNRVLLRQLVCSGPIVKLRYGWVLSAKIYGETPALFRSSMVTVVQTPNLLTVSEVRQHR